MPKLRTPDDWDDIMLLILETVLAVGVAAITVIVWGYLA